MSKAATAIVRRRVAATVAVLLLAAAALLVGGVLVERHTEPGFERPVVVSTGEHGGIFVAGSLLWGIVFDRFRPDRWDVSGALICLMGVAVIMYVPR